MTNALKNIPMTVLMLDPTVRCVRNSVNNRVKCNVHSDVVVLSTRTVQIVKNARKFG